MKYLPGGEVLGRGTGSAGLGLTDSSGGEEPVRDRRALLLADDLEDLVDPVVSLYPHELRVV
jgi:hypothetical protein